MLFSNQQLESRKINLDSIIYDANSKEKEISKLSELTEII